MTNITEDYVSFETAKLLKEKGFKELTYACFTIDGDDLYNYRAVGNDIMRPTLQMAMKWLREVHNYVISICLDSYVEPYDNEYYILIRRRKDPFEEISPGEQVFFKTYEEACEAAIKYCLENLI